MSYVFLRPHSMPGGKYHSPIWTPYALYGTIDYIYGWPAFNDNNGFTAAQTALNLIETAFYAYYLYAIYNAGAKDIFQFPDAKAFFVGDPSNVVRGPGVAKAVLCLFSAAVMTVSKTVLYCELDLAPPCQAKQTQTLHADQKGLNEYYSGFANIGHNSAFNLILLWMLPNGAWLILPGYMIYVLGVEILEAMDAAAMNKEE
jgi:hypothetical protein